MEKGAIQGKKFEEFKARDRQIKEREKNLETQTGRVDNQQVLSSFHPCGRALLSIVIGCLPSWDDELMSGF